MAIKVCDNNHITGFKTCPLCKASTTPQAPPFSVAYYTTQFRLDPVKAPAKKSFVNQFKEWRGRQRAKKLNRQFEWA